MYAEGVGVPRDYARSFHWFAEADRQGSGEAKYAMSTYFSLGVAGVADQDKAKAVVYQIDSALSGFKPSVGRLQQVLAQVSRAPRPSPRDRDYGSMVRVLLYLAVFAALAVGAVWLADRPGEVSVVWQGWRIDTSVALAAIAVVVLALLTMLGFGLLRFFLGLPSAFSFASRARRRARGFEAVSRGMVAIGAGDPVAAGRHAVDARRYAGSEPLTLLLEAQAAQLSGDRGRAEAAFKAMLDKPETRVLGLRGLFVERHDGLILDVAHNLESATVLAAQLRAEPCAGRTWLVLHGVDHARHLLEMVGQLLLDLLRLARAPRKGP
eukprot:gene35422-47608_t